MNVSAFALLLCILFWRSQSQETYQFTLRNIGETSFSHYFSVTTGSTLRFVCTSGFGGKISYALWIKNDDCVVQNKPHSEKCHVINKLICNNTVPSNIECDTKTSIKINNVTIGDIGVWRCIYYHPEGYAYYSDSYNVDVKPTAARTLPPKPLGTGSSTHQVKNTSISPRSSIKGNELTTIPQPAHPTGSEPASNSFLLLIVGAAVTGVLIITLMAIVVALKRKTSHKEGRASESSKDDNVPEVEMIDPDGQYASIGQMKPPVTVVETNPMYETYEGNQNRNQNQNPNQNQNQNQQGIISLNQVGEGDVYSVVNKPGKSTVQEAPSVVDICGDVYSVVQKKQDPPATDGVQAGTPGHDQGISDVYSVVQKPGKTSQ